MAKDGTNWFRIKTRNSVSSLEELEEEGEGIGAGGEDQKGLRDITFSSDSAGSVATISTPSLAMQDLSSNTEADEPRKKRSRAEKWRDLAAKGNAYDRWRKRTVIHSVLSSGVANGDKVLLSRLDDCVSLTRDAEDDPDCAIQVDLGPLIDGGAAAGVLQRRQREGDVQSGNDADIMKDILDFKDIPGALNILLHPVIQTFLEIKWRKIRRVYFLTFATYLLFLLSYSMYLANIFYRQDSSYKRRIRISELILVEGQNAREDRIVFPGNSNIEVEEPADGAGDDGDMDGLKNVTCGASAFKYCFTDTHQQIGYTCFLEILLAVSILLGILQETLQIFALGPRRYLVEFENLLELQVFALALAGLFLQSDMRVMKWVSAFGICLAYLELIFLMGRYPFLGGQVSLMFYSIVKHLFRSLSNFLVLIIGFGFGFFIMHHGKDNFENPYKAVFKTLAMCLGEFDFDALYDSHGEDSYSRTFSVLLMAGLAIMGSLVLVNLIVALIVTDMDVLRTAAHLQETVNKAQHVVFIESLTPTLPNWYRRWLRKKRCQEDGENRLLVCPHNMCRCGQYRLEPEIMRALVKIVKRRKFRASFPKGFCHECGCRAQDVAAD